jgi:hypothetical protein
MVVCALVMIGVAAAADTLYLNDGRVLVGELCGVTAYSVTFCVAGDVPRSFLLTEILRVELDFGANPNLRVAEADWRRAMSRARRELTSCRSARYGLILGGLAFMGGGYWLGLQGYEAGNLLIALGAVGAALGVIAPTPACLVQEARVKPLARIGLAHDWLY